ncbi:MAG: hypothetical protein U5L96_04720 [Owenweeksia sp.]|nr:hypothetical protein [Owenweeksia sp.]
MKASQLVHGHHLLDATGGLGIDTYYLAQKTKNATYVERDASLAHLAAANFAALRAPIEVKNQDGLLALRESKADLVYLDPHRRDQQNQKIISLRHYQPDVTQCLNQLTYPGRTSLIKVSPMLDLKAGYQELTAVKEIWIISLRNDCKEVIFMLNADAVAAPRLRTFNLLENGLRQI